MQRHRFDPISFCFGVVFAGLAAWVLFVDDLDFFDARWIWPGLLILGGLALLAPMLGGRSGSPVSPAAVTDDDDAARLAEAHAELPGEPHVS